ncbi:MAG: hypothetical protein P4L50_13515, partial [Anaerolineaceae bacterium]|nr:hypothetical protein [Anaerolineaceae bacterium]
ASRTGPGGTKTGKKRSLPMWQWQEIQEMLRVKLTEDHPALHPAYRLRFFRGRILEPDKSILPQAL